MSHWRNRQIPNDATASKQLDNTRASRETHVVGPHLIWICTESK